jgi:hypothetical protein
MSFNISRKAERLQVKKILSRQADRRRAAKATAANPPELAKAAQRDEACRSAVAFLDELEEGLRAAVEMQKKRLIEAVAGKLVKRSTVEKRRLRRLHDLEAEVEWYRKKPAPVAKKTTTMTRNPDGTFTSITSELERPGLVPPSQRAADPAIDAIMAKAMAIVLQRQLEKTNQGLAV